MALPCKFLCPFSVDTALGCRLDGCVPVLCDSLEVAKSSCSRDACAIDESLCTVEIHLGETEDNRVVGIDRAEALAEILHGEEGVAVIVRHYEKASDILRLIEVEEILGCTAVTVAVEAGHTADILVAAAVRLGEVLVDFEDNLAFGWNVLGEDAAELTVLDGGNLVRSPHLVLTAVDHECCVICSLLPLLAVEIDS